MSRVYIDTMVWIYALESSPSFGIQAQQVLRAVHTGRHTLFATHFLLAELLVGPQKERNLLLAALYRRLLISEQVELVPLSERFALTFATIRAQHKVSAPDAIHVALAVTAEVDLFVTSDRRLHRVMIPGLGRVSDLSETVPILTA